MPAYQDHDITMMWIGVGLGKTETTGTTDTGAQGMNPTAGIKGVLMAETGVIILRGHQNGITTDITVVHTRETGHPKEIDATKDGGLIRLPMYLYAQ